MTAPLGSVKRASIWTLAGYGGSQVLRLGGNLVLWRLLYPEAFGMMSLVNVFMQGLAMFSDIGIGPSIIQNQRGEEPDHQNTAFTMQAMRGVALCVIAILLAKPVAHFYGEPELASLIPVVSFGAVIAGLNSTNMFTATRRIALGRITMMDLVSQGAGLTAMIAWGFLFRNIWALVVGGLVSNAVRLGMSHLFLPGIRNRFRWEPERARALMHFGRWIFFSTVLSFAVAQSDRLIFAKLIPMGVLGVYSIATVWAQLPASIIDRVFNSVVFPLLSSRYHAGVALSPTFVASRRPWLIFAGWAASCLLAGGPTLIHFFYDSRAAQAGWIVQTLAVSTWLYTLETTNSSVLMAVGKPSWIAVGSAAKLAGMLVGIPLGFAHYGFPGAVFGLAASEFLRYVTSVIGARRVGVAGLAEDTLLSLLMAASAGAGLLVRRAVTPAFAGLSLPHPKIALVLIGTCIAMVVTLPWGALFIRHRRTASVQPTP